METDKWPARGLFPSRLVAVVAGPSIHYPGTVSVLCVDGSCIDCDSPTPLWEWSTPIQITLHLPQTLSAVLFQEQKLKETRLLRSQCAACLALGRRFWLAQGHLGSPNEGLMKLMKTLILKATILDTACIQKAKIRSPVRYRLAMGGAVGHEEERSEGHATQHGFLAVGLCRLFSSGWFSDA